MVDSLDEGQVFGESDRWAKRFFRAMLAGELSVEDFEGAVNDRWQARDFVVRAPATAAWLHECATGGAWTDAGYAHAAPQLGFRSHFMIGVPGIPGAIFIEAPPEGDGPRGLHTLNRPLHQHDSGRIAVITRGAAIFHVAPDGGPGGVMLDCPVAAGDVVFWPAWTAHTFDALDGFSLVSAMADYVSPAADGFVFPVDDELASRPRQSYVSIRAA